MQFQHIRKFAVLCCWNVAWDSQTFLGSSKPIICPLFNLSRSNSTATEFFLSFAADVNMFRMLLKFYASNNTMTEITDLLIYRSLTKKYFSFRATLNELNIFISFAIVESTKSFAFYTIFTPEKKAIMHTFSVIFTYLR